MCARASSASRISRGHTITAAHGVVGRAGPTGHGGAVRWHWLGRGRGEEGRDGQKGHGCATTIGEERGCGEELSAGGGGRDGSWARTGLGAALGREACRRGPYQKRALKPSG